MIRVLRWLTRNKWLKLLSVVLAASLWVYVTNKSNTVRSGMPVTVEVVAPDGLVVLKQSISQVELDLYGLTTMVDRVSPDNLTVKIRLADRKNVNLPVSYEQPGTVSVKIETSDVEGLPPTVEIRKVVPDTLTVTLDKLDTATLPVEIDKVVGTVRQGLKIVNISPPKQKVIVTGPKSILGQRKSIKLKPIPVDDLGDDHPGNMIPLEGASLDLSDPVGGPDCLKAAAVGPITVYITLGWDLEQKIVDRVPIVFHGLPDYRYSAYSEDMAGEAITNLENVAVECPKGVDPKDAGIKAVIDMTEQQDVTKLEVTIPVQFECPPGIRVLSTPKVRVKIQRPTAPTTG